MGSVVKQPDGSIQVLQRRGEDDIELCWTIIEYRPFIEPRLIAVVISSESQITREQAEEMLDHHWNYELYNGDRLLGYFLRKDVAEYYKESVFGELEHLQDLEIEEREQGYA